MKTTVLETSSRVSFESKTLRKFDNYTINEIETKLSLECFFVGELDDNHLIILRNIVAVTIDAMSNGIYKETLIRYTNPEFDNFINKENEK